MANVKETTGIMGLDVFLNVREVLIGLYTKTLKEIQAVLEDEGYQWDPWGVPHDYECEVVENDAPIPKHVPYHRPPPLPEEFFKTLEAVSSKGHSCGQLR